MAEREARLNQRYQHTLRDASRQIQSGHDTANQLQQALDLTRQQADQALQGQRQTIVGEAEEAMRQQRARVFSEAEEAIQQETHSMQQMEAVFFDRFNDMQNMAEGEVLQRVGEIRHLQILVQDQRQEHAEYTYEREQWFQQEVQGYTQHQQEVLQRTQQRWEDECTRQWQQLQAESRVAKKHEQDAQIARNIAVADAKGDLERARIIDVESQCQLLECEKDDLLREKIEYQQQAQQSLNRINIATAQSKEAAEADLLRAEEAAFKAMDECREECSEARAEAEADRITANFANVRIAHIAKEKEDLEEQMEQLQAMWQPGGVFPGRPEPSTAEFPTGPAPVPSPAPKSERSFFGWENEGKEGEPQETGFINKEDSSSDPLSAGAANLDSSACAVLPSGCAQFSSTSDSSCSRHGG